MPTKKKTAEVAPTETPAEAPAKKMAIFIDGANLWNMGRIMGIGKMDHRFLYKLLTQLGDPALPLACRPVVTTNSERQLKTLEALDYEPVYTESRNGTDDRILIERIRELDLAEVVRVVMVTSDGDFYKIANELVEQGVEVWIVGTKTKSPGTGGPMLSHALNDPEKFHLVELADYLDRLMLAPWVERPQPGVEPVIDRSVISDVQHHRVARLEIELSGDVDATMWNNVVSKIAGAVHCASIGGLKVSFTIDPK